MKKTLVLGLGLSGKAAIDLLTDQKVPYVFFEDNQQKLSEYCKHTENTAVFDNSKDLSSINEIIVSPGIPPSHSLIQRALKEGVAVKTEFDLALQYHVPKNLLLITGTNGKSSVCDMVSHVLKKQGHPHFVGGNFGTPCCEFVKTKDDLVILEVSSYHLHYAVHIPKAVGMWTNFSMDHQEWHRTMGAYFQTKLRLLEACAASGSPFLVGPSVLKNFKESLLYKTSSLKLEQIQLALLGDEKLKQRLPSEWPEHQKQNALFTCKALNLLINQKDGLSLKALQDYSGLPYRFEELSKAGEHRIINDSKSTNLHSTLAAIESLNDNEGFYLLLGGASKGEDFSEITNTKNKALLKHVFCYGRDGSKIFERLDFPHKTLVESLESAVNSTKKRFENDPATVLFSPGCASFDEFSNYLERGKAFSKLFLATK